MKQIQALDISSGNVFLISYAAIGKKIMIAQLNKAMVFKRKMELFQI